jgi:hypothetical protein
MQKQCFKCGVTKAHEEFYRHARMADGYLNKCKECAKEDTRVHRGANLDSIRAYDRERGRTEERRTANLEINKRWRAEHPERRRAEEKIRRAVREGKMKRCVCWVCGSEAEAHHPDYSRPLDVVWLCRPHHAQTHALVRAS